MPTYAQYLSGRAGRKANVSSFGYSPSGNFSGYRGAAGLTGINAPNPQAGSRAEFDKMWQSTGAVGDMGPGSFMRQRLIQDWVNAGPSAWGKVPPGLEQFFRRRDVPSSGSAGIGTGSFLANYQAGQQGQIGVPGLPPMVGVRPGAGSPYDFIKYLQEQQANPSQPYRPYRPPYSPYGYNQGLLYRPMALK